MIYFAILSAQGAFEGVRRVSKAAGQRLVGVAEPFIYRSLIRL